MALLDSFVRQIKQIVQTRLISIESQPKKVVVLVVFIVGLVVVSLVAAVVVVFVAVVVVVVHVVVVDPRNLPLKFC